jgi:hypothetical protein
VEHLTLQIRNVHDVEVDESERADASGREVQGEWRTETARPDEQNAPGLELSLTIDPDIGKNEVPAVSEHLLVGQRVATVEMWHLVILRRSPAPP